MAAQNGKDLLIKLDLNGDESFETIAGLRATRITFNAETVDVTSLESEGRWRELLGAPGFARRRFPARECSGMRRRTSGHARFSSKEKCPIFR